MKPRDYRELSCRECLEGAPLGFDFTMAFQPIVDLGRWGEIFAYEALVRGVDGEGAGHVLGQVDDGNRYRFDQMCRVKAVELASRLGMASRLSINFLPNAIYKPETCIRTTLAATDEFGFEPEKIIFEVTEVEPIEDTGHLRHIFDYYQKRGFLTAIDDFGSGFAGLSMLADFKPQIIKLDMSLIRNIHEDKARQAIIQGALATCRSMNIGVVAEGVETREELAYLKGVGVTLFQGYLFARPQVEQLPEVDVEAFMD